VTILTEQKIIWQRSVVRIHWFTDSRKNMCSANRKSQPARRWSRLEWILLGKCAESQTGRSI